MCDTDEPLEAWIQTTLGKMKIELIDVPRWSRLLSGGRWQLWVEYRDPIPRATACSGTPMVRVSDVHPLTRTAREFLKAHDPKPLPPSKTWL